MAITYLTQFNSASTVNATSYTTSSISTTSGNLIVVIAAVMTNGGTSDPSPNITCSDSLTSTYTSVANIGNASSWSMGFQVFTLVSNGTARTITIADSIDAEYQWELIVLELSGATGTVNGLITNSNAGDNVISLTLTATPTSNDLTLFARYIDGGVNGSPPTFTMDAGWDATIEANSDNTNQGGVLGLSARTGSTSTTVSCTDATSATGSYAGGKCIALALTFVGSGGGEEVAPDYNFDIFSFGMFSIL